MVFCSKPWGRIALRDVGHAEVLLHYERDRAAQPRLRRVVGRDDASRGLAKRAAFQYPGQ